MFQLIWREYYLLSFEINNAEEIMLVSKRLMIMTNKYH